LEDEFEEELFARQKQQSERIMKIAVALLAAVFLFVFYFLMQNG
jgi:hypothetical protein